MRNQRKSKLSGALEPQIGQPPLAVVRRWRVRNVYYYFVQFANSSPFIRLKCSVLLVIN